jgi:hypothetical protein
MESVSQLIKVKVSLCFFKLITTPLRRIRE